MLADPLRGRFTGFRADGPVMLMIAGASLQLAIPASTGLLDKRSLFPDGISIGPLLWWSLFAVIAHRVFSFAHLHHCRTRSLSMLALSLVRACALTTYLLAFYLVASHRSLDYLRVLTAFYFFAFFYQAARYKLRSIYLAKHPEPVLILGTAREAQKVWRHIRIHCDRLVAFKGFVAESPTRDAAPDILARVACTIEGLEDYLQRCPVDTMILTTSGATDAPFANQAIRISQQCGIRLLCIHEPYEDLPRPLTLKTNCEQYVEYLRPNRLRQTSLILKASSDRAFAAAALLLLSPLALPLLVLYQVILGHPALVSQPAFGRRRRLFRVWRVRVVTPGRDLPLHTSDHKPILAQARAALLTRIGQFLNGSGLAHAPRLWNVLSGNMSLVGPAPVFYAPGVPTCETFFLRRFTMLPGLCSPPPSPLAAFIEPASQQDESIRAYLDHWSLVLDWHIFSTWLPSSARRVLYAVAALLLPVHPTLTETLQRTR